jgi:hypothetical protein
VNSRESTFLYTKVDRCLVIQYELGWTGFDHRIQLPLGKNIFRQIWKTRATTKGAKTTIYMPISEVLLRHFLTKHSEQWGWLMKKISFSIPTFTFNMINSKYRNTQVPNFLIIIYVKVNKRALLVILWSQPDTIAIKYWEREKN